MIVLAVFALVLGFFILLAIDNVVCAIREATTVAQALTKTGDTSPAESAATRLLTTLERVAVALERIAEAQDKRARALDWRREE